MPKITPFLWFNGNLEEAVNFYTAIFKNAKIDEIIRSRETEAGKPGSVVSATFELEGQTFIGFNGAPRSVSRRRFHCSFAASHRKNSMSTGRGCQMAASLSDAVGGRIDLAFRDRSCR